MKVLFAFELVLSVWSKMVDIEGGVDVNNVVGDDLDDQEQRRAIELIPAVRAKWAMYLLKTIVIRFSILLGIVFILCVFYAGPLILDLVITTPVTIVCFFLLIIYANFTKIDYTCWFDFTNSLSVTVFNVVYIVIAIVVIIMNLWFIFERNLFLILICSAFLLGTQLLFIVEMIQWILGGRLYACEFKDFTYLSMDLSWRTIYTYSLIAPLVIMVNHNEVILRDIILHLIHNIINKLH